MCCFLVFCSHSCGHLLASEILPVHARWFCDMSGCLARPMYCHIGLYQEDVVGDAMTTLRDMSVNRGVYECHVK